jgi:hypothetical protein
LKNEKKPVEVDLLYLSLITPPHKCYILFHPHKYNIIHEKYSEIPFKEFKELTPSTFPEADTYGYTNILPYIVYGGFGLAISYIGYHTYKYFTENKK